MARLPEAPEGVRVKEHLSGFPFFNFSPQKGILISDIWEYLKTLATEKINNKKLRFKKKNEEHYEAESYIGQAFEYYEAAKNPRLRSRPLLYYYSFMNLAKLYLLLEDVAFPVKVNHGISDIEIPGRPTIRSAEVKIYPPLSKKRSNLFAIFVGALGYPINNFIRDYRVIDLLKQIPCINDTYSRALRESANFIRINRIAITRESNNYWVRIFIKKGPESYRALVRDFTSSSVFTSVFKGVVVKDGDKQDNFIFDLRPNVLAKGKGPSVNNAINTLGQSFSQLKLSAILTRDGYRYYFNTIDPSVYFPCLAAEYAVAFFLGSITRYRPRYFDNINRGLTTALIYEYLSIVPTQFVYKLASKIARTEVLIPYGLV